MLEFEILARGLYRQDQLVISYDPALRMPTNLEFRVWMDELWQQKLALAHEQDIPLYDAQLFRLVAVEGRGDGMLHVVLGNTSYKEYTVTRDPVFFQGRDHEELGNPLAVCSVIETTDGYILYEKRHRVVVHEGRYHVIGGFCDRGRDMDNSGHPDPFAAMRREMREETGIQVADIREQFCLGCVYDVGTPHGELCFLTQLNIPLATVHSRVPEEDEIQQLLSLHVTRESLRDFLLSNHGNISATGEPNLLMYGALRFGEAWYEAIMGKR